MKPTIFRINSPYSGQLAILARPRGNEWLSDEMAALSKAGVDVIVSLLEDNENFELGLQDETACAREHGITFVSFPIRDYGVPRSEKDAEKLIHGLVDYLTRGKTVGVHCRQGIGRSSLIVACLLNQTIEDTDECFHRIQLARGTAVPDTIEQREWVRAFAKTLTEQTVNR